MVMARSFGRRFFCRFAHCAASKSSAVESGPPETAITNPGKPSKPRSSALASSSRTASSAVGTLLFPVHVLLHGQRRARIFAQYLAERSAGGFLFAQGSKRLAK